MVVIAQRVRALLDLTVRPMVLNSSAYDYVNKVEPIPIKRLSLQLVYVRTELLVH